MYVYVVKEYNYRPVDNGAAGAAMAAPLFSQIKICNPLKLNV